MSGTRVSGLLGAGYPGSDQPAWRTVLPAALHSSWKNRTPSPSRGGLGCGWVASGTRKPIPLPASPLKGEEPITRRGQAVRRTLPTSPLGRSPSPGAGRPFGAPSQPLPWGGAHHQARAGHSAHPPNLSLGEEPIIDCRDSRQIPFRAHHYASPDRFQPNVGPRRTRPSCIAGALPCAARYRRCPPVGRRFTSCGRSARRHRAPPFRA